MTKKADVGVFGGSGFYSFLEDIEEIEVETPYGKPSDKIALATYEGKRIAFLPRHGKNHDRPPHLINYRANVYAMKELGVKCILGSNASGSLKPEIKPGDFVICNDFVDRTWGRKDTFFEGPEVKHVSGANCYCDYLREIAAKVGRAQNINVHEEGTVVVIQGPRFSTTAESRWFSSMGWDVVNMTQYPENILCRELGICYVNIALITDYDAGLEGRDDIQPVTFEEVGRVFNENTVKVKQMMLEIIKNIDLNKLETCKCKQPF